MISSSQYRKLMRLYEASGNITQSALQSGMNRRTARRYILEGLPSAKKDSRTWRTRKDPFAAVTDEAKEILRSNPHMTARDLFLTLQERYPGEFGDGSLRTLHRRVKIWRKEKQ